MSALLCEKCGAEIQVGDPVEFIHAGDDQPRVTTSEESLVVHADCENPRPREVGPHFARPVEGQHGGACRYCGKPIELRGLNNVWRHEGDPI